jgi:hypothetical protein
MPMKCEAKHPQFFKQIVEKSLAVFAVFTGATLSFYVKDFLFSEKLPAGFKDFPGWARVCILAAAVALLLRYILGSAVHLNHVYVPETAGGDPRSKSLCCLFFDIVFLVVFGMLSIFITQANDMTDFMLRVVYFIGAGMAWSVAALLRQNQRSIAGKWLVVDVIQLVFTLALICRAHIACVGTVIDARGGDLLVAAILAPVYLIFLYVDFYGQVNWIDGKD